MHQIFSLTPGTYIQYCTHWNYPLGNDRQWNYETLRVDVYYRRRPLRHRPPWRLNRPKRRRHRGPGRRSGRRWESNIIFDLIWFDLIWFVFLFFFSFNEHIASFFDWEKKIKKNKKWNEMKMGGGKGRYGEEWISIQSGFGSVSLNSAIARCLHRINTRAACNRFVLPDGDSFWIKILLISYVGREGGWGGWWWKEMIR